MPQKTPHGLSRRYGELAGFGMGMVAVAMMSPIPPVWQVFATGFFAVGTLLVIGWQVRMQLKRRRSTDKPTSWWSFLL